MHHEYESCVFQTVTSLDIVYDSYFNLRLEYSIVDVITNKKFQF